MTEVRTVDHSFINQMISILKEMKCKFHLILGNHDIIGRNLDSNSTSTIGLLRHANVIHLLEKPSRIEDFMLAPYSYNENQIAEDYYKLPGVGDFDANLLPRIVITHNMILPQPAIFTHILASNVARHVPPKTLFLIGHYHVPFFFTEDGIKFVNIGSAGRVSRSPGENRVPEYAIITLTGSEYDVDRRPFPSAKLWDNVFEPKLESKSDNAIIDAKEFFNSYTDKSLDLNDIMSALSVKMKIDPKVVEESKLRLEAARHRMTIENNKYG